MKKLISIVLLSLILCNAGYSEDILSVNSFLKKGFKITNEELIKGEGTLSLKILTLRKGNSEYAICTIALSRIGPRKANCLKP